MYMSRSYGGESEATQFSREKSVKVHFKILQVNNIMMPITLTQNNSLKSTVFELYFMSKAFQQLSIPKTVISNFEAVLMLGCILVEHSDAS